MGHEMTHGFDIDGRQFDMNGNLIDWWDPETKKKYLQRAQCIVDQYSNYTVEEIGLKVSLLLQCNGFNSKLQFSYKKIIAI
jgi:membrane metallo-endopeptidase-like protein 1